MRLLLTGSNGFVGGRIATEAQARGHDVIGLGRAAHPAHALGGYIRHDLAEPLVGVFGDRVDAVVHCAALSVPWAAPAAFARANQDGTRHVVEWCRANGQPPLVYISSSSVFYRNADQLDLTEDSPIPPAREQLTAYSRTKRAGELLTQEYPGAWTILRPRAVFGPGDTVLLPRIIAAARRGRLPLLERRDGRRVVCDLIYVDNVAQYVLTAVEQGITGVYNLTNGEPVELYPFLFDALDQLGCPRPTRRVPIGLAMGAARAMETASAVFAGYREPPITRFGVSVFAYSKTFDVRKCHRDLGRPAVGLAEGVARLVTSFAG
ncbi:MAG: NAD(P)-dependent oxidoreductase [Dactylosporangium sp.]|nr:NAD(P)-dependent oxidoreductase [Dactylosporangium sp.]NNJ62270.1 NAD(P)-dependent oxidoreductase [Dactylosporangium sp.]